MTEKRKRYDDSYTPVFDIPSPEENEEPIVVRPRSGAATPQSQVETPAQRQRSKRVTHTRKSKGGKTATVANDAASGEKQSWFGAIGKALTSQTAHWITGIVLGGFGLYLLVAFVSYFSNCVKDQAAIANTALGSLPPVGNAAGEGGARLAEFFINEGYGLGSFVLILWLVALSMKLLIGWPKFKTVNFTIKCIVAFITLSLIVGLLTLSLNSPVNWGGFHGRYVNEFIVGFAGWTGAVILCVMLVAIFVVICMRDFVNWVIRKRKALAERRRIAAEAKAEKERIQRQIDEMRRREAEDAARAGDAHPEQENVADEDNVMKFGGEDVKIDPTLPDYDIEDEEDEPQSASSSFGVNAAEHGAAAGSVMSDTTPGVASVAEGATEMAASAAVAEGAVEMAASTAVAEGAAEMAASAAEKEGETAVGGGEQEGVASEKIAADVAANEDKIEADGTDRMVVNVNQIATTAPTQTGSRPDDSLIKRMYKFPSPLLLREGEQKISVDVEEQQANKERIRETLLYHNIPITSIEATVGPTVTLYEIRPEQGVKISKIKNLADDIALSLSAIGVRIIAPIPGKGTVGIEVANREPQTVSMRTIILSRKYNETRFRLPVALGSTIGNDVYIADLTKMPHLLVAGATGQGKSVGLNAIIASLLYKKRPDELKFVMIDPKEVEFSLYAKIEQHYLAKLDDCDAIVTDMSKVVNVLQSLCVEMDNRYKLLRTAEVRNLEEYNAKIAQGRLSPSDGHRFLPYIVLVVDEFADLIMTSGKEVETPIARLAQKARAIGIHVIIATQRPSTNVITGIIKANFPVRIAFKVSSGIDSKTILDTTGAQSLIGKGDMLISNNSEMVRVQCAFIDTPEVEEICNYISRQPFNSGPYMLPEPLGMGGDSEGGTSGHGGGELDELFAQAGEVVVTSGLGSTSGIQRRFSIGYARAGKIMDQLEHHGVVGPSLGGKPRQVLMDERSFDELLHTLGER